MRLYHNKCDQLPLIQTGSNETYTCNLRSVIHSLCGHTRLLSPLPNPIIRVLTMQVGTNSFRLRLTCVLVYQLVSTNRSHGRFERYTIHPGMGSSHFNNRSTITRLNFNVVLYSPLSALTVLHWFVRFIKNLIFELAIEVISKKYSAILLE